jgi:hypothetical protein
MCHWGGVCVPAARLLDPLLAVRVLLDRRATATALLRIAPALSQHGVRAPPTFQFDSLAALQTADPGWCEATSYLIG